MKKILFIALSIFSQSAFSQTMTFDEAFKKSSDVLPEQISKQYPTFFKTLLSAQKEDTYILKIVYGEFEGKLPVRYINDKGTIIIDTKYFSSNINNIEGFANWNLYNNIGTIHYFKDNSKVSLDYNGAKSKYYYALGKAKEQAEKGYCLTLKAGINNLFGASKSAADLNLKQAALDVTNDNLFKQCIEISKLKGCPLDNAPLVSNTSNTIVTNTANDQSNHQLSSNTVVNEDEILGNLKLKVDNITNSMIYYDKRTGFDNLYGEGLHASLIKMKNKYHLRMSYYHIPFREFNPPKVTKVLINTGENEPVSLNFNPFIGVNADIQANLTKNSFHYVLLSKVVANNTCKIRFIMDNGRFVDYSLGKREISEIATVLEAYEKLNGLN